MFSVLAAFVSAFKNRGVLALENLALRQQVVLHKRSVKRPRVTGMDRLFWAVFAHFVSEWRSMLQALHPDAIARWHRDGFRCYRTWKSRRVGRPSIETELGALIRTMRTENITWDAPLIHGELLKLGFHLCETTVAKYMKRYRKPPSQSWHAFLANHADGFAAVDSLTVPTATFRVLYVLIVLDHARRRIVHFNVTAHL